MKTTDDKIEKAFGELERMYREGVKPYREERYRNEVYEKSPRVFSGSLHLGHNHVEVDFAKKEIRWEDWDEHPHNGSAFNEESGTLPWNSLKKPEYLWWLREELATFYEAYAKLEADLARRAEARRKANELLGEEVER